MGKFYPGPAGHFSGKFNGISIYELKGVGLVARKSGGHSKEKQKRDDKLDLFCRAGTEFGGRSALAKQVKWALRLHKFCMDPNVAGRLNAVLKPVQVLDNISELGKRNIYLSAHKDYLKGFSLSKEQPFDTVVSLSPQCTIDRANLTATIKIPAMIPGVNFHTKDQSPHFCFIATLAAVPDVVWSSGRYVSVFDSAQSPSYADADGRTGWFSLLGGSPAQEMILRSDDRPPNDNFTLVVTIGICYGVQQTVHEIAMKPYGGSGKILDVG